MINSIFLHKVIALLALSIAANLDNLGVGIAYGMRKSRISATSNFLIAVISASLTYIAMVFGKFLERLLPTWMINDLGAIIIIGVGIWIYFESEIKLVWILVRHWVWHYFSFQFARLPSEVTQRNLKKPSSRILSLIPIFPGYLSGNRREFLALKETSLLGFSLSLNAIAGGFGASLSGYNPLLTSAGIGVFSYFTIAAGQKLSGTYFSKWLGGLAHKVAGLVLLLVGVYELFF